MKRYHYLSLSQDGFTRLIAGPIYLVNFIVDFSSEARNGLHVRGACPTQ
jgi:hypothetical protein